MSRYAAFITYSHADATIASWLQKSLETYRIPHNLERIREDLRARRRLGAIFRDRDELSAGSDLGEEIRNALSASEFLIVVCSPAATQSRWVNLEIEEFARTHSPDKILCVIAAGEPLASLTAGQSDQECFPPALGYGTTTESTFRRAEPIAADLRPERDGRKLALLKLIAGLLSIPLDSLVQRDAQRRHRRLVGLSAASFAGTLVMLALTIIAVDARNGEQLRRAEAEDLIEFMLGDLRNRLEAVGRLDVLDAVGAKTVEYYSNTDVANQSGTSLGRRARAFLLLGEVDDLRGDTAAAQSAFEEAYTTTRELVRRSPNSTELIFDHAQSAFWVGFLAWRRGEYAQANTAFEEYLLLTERLNAIEPDNLSWLAESGYANQNLGVNALSTGNAELAVRHLGEARSLFETVVRAAPDNVEWRWSLAQMHAWLADANERLGNFAEAVNRRLTELDIYEALLADDPDNQDIRLSILTSKQLQAALWMQQGQIDAAISLLSDARSIGEELRNLDSQNTLTAQLLASICSDLAVAYSFADSSERSGALFTQAESIADELVGTDETVFEWQRLRAQIRVQHQKFRLRTSGVDTIELVAELESSADEIDRLASENPGEPELLSVLGDARLALADAQLAANLREAAALQSELVVAELAPMRSQLPPNGLATLSLALAAGGNAEEADEIASVLDAIGFAEPGYLERRQR